MKKLFCILAIIGLFFATETFAQQGRVAVKKDGKAVTAKKKGKVKAAKRLLYDANKPATERADFLTSSMTNMLALNPQQQNEVYQINLNTAKKVDVLRADRDNDIRGFKRQLKEVYSKRDGAIKRLLTSQQVSSYRDVKRALKQTRKNLY